MRKTALFLWLLLLSMLFRALVTPGIARAQFPSACDKVKDCTGNALSISITAGKGAQYVDIDTSYRLHLDTAITFEAWVRPEQQPGKVQYIAGLWGPNHDNNDAWVLYVQDTKVVFALSADNSYKSDSDNTIAIATVPDLYSKGWRHIAAVWEATSTTARIYIDGVLAASAANLKYPLTRMHEPENRLLPMQIGSCNALYDDTVRNRAWKGMLDEIRLWNRALNGTEIACQRLLSLNGNEPGLELYYRCNEDKYVQTLCDATGRNHVGRMRSGATCDSSDRVVPVMYSVTPASLSTKLVCTQDTTFTFTILDTNACGDRVSLGVSGVDAGLFSLSTNALTLAKGIPQTFTVRVRAALIGTINATIDIVNANRCGEPLSIPITIQRITELTYTLGRLKLDTLYVGCQDKMFSEASVTICNPTGHPIHITSIGTDSGYFNWSSPGLSLPKTLSTSECITVTVRMNMLDSSRTFYDTLRIGSDEACSGAGIIPLTGRVQDVMGLLFPDGKRRLDSMRFETVCPGMISNPQTYQYRSLGSDTVRIDTIIYDPSNFFGFRFQYPITLVPKQAYLPTPIRFRPDQPGPFAGTITFRGRYKGCTLVKTVYVSGRGYSVDVVFKTPSADFGLVTIGKAGTLNAPVYDSGSDPRKINAYLKIGDVFTITGNKSFNISPGQTQQITLQFRPRQPITYYDTLCIFDEGCFETRSIPVSGTGVFEAFSFDPPYLSLPNIVGCQSGTGKITLKNISGGPVTITSNVLTDPTGRFSVAQFAPNGPFAANQSFTYDVTYTPNDLTVDRADDAYIEVTLSDGQVYRMLLRATSVAPRIYVTPLTTYGVVEVGWQKRDSILIENASLIPERITNISIPNGYTIVSSTPAVPCTLGPRDSLWVVVDFKPTGDSDYNGNIIVSVDSPCVVSYSGALTGHGTSVKLQVPVSFMNYGMVRPCDCADREIPLGNYSNLIPITVDSVWIDGQGVTPLVPSTFRWKRKSNGSQTLPFTIAPQQADTLVISFCPNIPATKANLVKNDTLHIAAHTPGWSALFRTMLSGRREMNFTPSRALVSFPATRVDTSAQPMPVDITVPDFLTNPSADSIVITDVTFKPDQRVFSAVAANGKPLPWVVQRNKKFSILVNFYPRAPKTYTARMQIHTSFPCDGVDTTVLVTGTGFAPAFGLQVAFDTARVGQDTIRLTTCDTLVLPIMSSRDIPQKYIDMYFHLGYDTSALQLIDGFSQFTSTVVTSDTTDGANVILKDAVDVQAGVVTYVRLKVKGGPTTFPILLNGINFDSDSLVFFKIVAGIDHAVVQIDEPRIAVSKITAFDTVNIKSCKDQIVTVYNPGLIPIRFDSLSGLPKWHTVTASSVPLPDTLQPGDSLKLTVTFCPRDEVLFDTSLLSLSNAPCLIMDTSHLTSFGYAPPFPFRMQLSPDLASIDSIGGRIADTIEVPVLVDRDIPQTPLDMRFVVQYNPRALQYLSASSTYSVPVVLDSLGALGITLPGSDSVRTGEIARLRFVIAVPDSIVSFMSLTPGKFTSDSIFWVKPRPQGDTSIVSVGARCNITRLNFRGGTNSITVPKPNPATNSIEVDMNVVEDAATDLRIYDMSGNQVQAVFDGSRMLRGGSYHLAIATNRLAGGAYTLNLRHGSYTQSVRFVVVR